MTVASAGASVSTGKQRGRQQNNDGGAAARHGALTGPGGLLFPVPTLVELAVVAVGETVILLKLPLYVY